MVIQTETSNPDKLRKSQAMEDFENLIERLADKATPADRQYISDLINPQAAVLYRDRQW